MEIAEKILYHQMHPIKLATDSISGLLTIFFLWNHELVPAFSVVFIPPLTVSILLIATEDFENYKNSEAGNKMNARMTVPVMLTRLAGFAVASGGAWYQSLTAIVLGLAVVAICWFYVFRN